MADQVWPPLELSKSVEIVLRDLPNPLVGEDLRVLIGRLDSVRVIGPAWGERRVALLFKEGTPAVPTRREEPEAMHEHDGLLPLRVGSVDFLLFMGCEICHV